MSTCIAALMLSVPLRTVGIWSAGGALMKSNPDSLSHAQPILQKNQEKVWSKGSH